MNDILSVNNVKIRLTDERWYHIIENHDDLNGFRNEVLNTVELPDLIIRGYRDALIALKIIQENRYLAVIYKEINNEDGFIITAYFTSKINLDKEVILWRPQ